MSNREYLCRHLWPVYDTLHDWEHLLQIFKQHIRNAFALTVHVEVILLAFVLDKEGGGFRGRHVCVGLDRGNGDISGGEPYIRTIAKEEQRGRGFSIAVWKYCW